MAKQAKDPAYRFEGQGRAALLLLHGIVNARDSLADQPRR
jgi:hypothetical protein